MERGCEELRYHAVTLRNDYIKCLHTTPFVGPRT